MMYPIVNGSGVWLNILWRRGRSFMSMKMGIIGFGGMGAYHFANIRDRIDCLDVKGDRKSVV